jgi:hypothetical protein
MADTDVLEKPDTLPATGPTSAAEVVKAPGLTPRPDIKGASQADVEAALANQNKVAEETTARLKASQAQHDQMAQQHVAIPGVPKLQNVTPPPKFEYQDTMQVFQSPAVLLAALGSIFTRAPMTAALKAGAAAMEGFKNGQKEVADLHLEQWKASMDYAQKQNAIEMERYKAVMENSRLSIADKAARMQAIAAANQDQMMIAATSSGNVQRVFEIMHAREQAADKLTEAGARFAQQKELAEIRAGLTPDQQAVLESRAQAIAKGQLPGIANPRQPQDRATMARVMEINPGYKESDYSVDKANKTSAARALGTVETKFGVAEKAMEESIPIAKAASEAVPRGQWRAINELIQRGQTESGDPAVRRLLIATDTAVKDYARTINPQGVLRESDIEYARSIVSKADSPEVYNAALDQLGVEAQVMHRAIQRQKAEQGLGTGNTGGISAAPAGPAVGEVRKGYRFKGGDPAQQSSWEKV